jgi:hypothetical protein
MTCLTVGLTVCLFLNGLNGNDKSALAQQSPSRTELIAPIHKESFDNDGQCRQRKQGGNARQVNGYVVFDGAQDGNRQVDPQIAVGGGFVFHATNSGLLIYKKDGTYINGVSQNCFNGGIDPKLFYSRHHKNFVFDLWNPWDKAKLKPVNVAVSETDDPTGAWNIYPIPAPDGKDGGGVGYSSKWIGYSFPGGKEQTFVFPATPAKSGTAVDVYHFEGNFGQPVFTQDDTKDLYFLNVGREIVLTKITDSGDGTPVAVEAARQKNELEYFGWPPKSPQSGTDQKTSSGDRRPKNIVLSGGFLWWSHAVNCDGRSAVQWHQMNLDGTFVQSGMIRDEKRSFIQTTVAVNMHNDLIVGFQEVGNDMFISPRFAFRRASDPKGTLRETVSIGEGQGSTDGVAWGDYSGSTVDGDNRIDLWTIQSVTDKDGKGDTVIAKLPGEEK